MLGWSDLGVVLGAAAAVLLAALLVAAAIRPAALPGTRPLHTLSLLATVLVAGIALTVVRQPPAALGVELVLLGVATGTLAVLLDRRGTGIIGAGTPNLIAAALVAAGGISVLAGEEGGLGLLVVGAVGALLGAVVNAWLLLSAVAASTPVAEGGAETVEGPGGVARGPGL